jgi:N utilization substance protein B
MSHRSAIRRRAMQVLYEIDATGQTDPQVLADNIDDADEPPKARAEAVALACAAWAEREALDGHVSAVAPDWPTHRQPPVDRAILRLAVHEMVTGRTPPKVAINEAIELAKKFSNENAPRFVNGVLDKLHRTLDLPAAAADDAPPPKAADADAWLNDAKSD